MKKLLILSFLLLNLKCLVAGDDQENLSSLQFNKFNSDGKLPLSNKQHNLRAYFCMFNPANSSQAPSRNASRTSNVS
ncbi:MAG: hypothetical protein ACXWL5_03845, partial [Candidatus Chromulinivorax sp.]